MIKNPNTAYAGIVQKFIGSAYDVVYAVYLRLDDLRQTTAPYIQDMPPENMYEGMRWFNALEGRTYVWYVNEGETVAEGQWVEDSPQANYKSE